MSADKFFRAGGPKPEWDGKPVIAMSFEQATMLINGFCPTYHLHMLGPVPFGQAERYVLHIQGIIRATKEEVVAMSDGWARVACEQAGYPYDPDEWEISDIVLVNGN